MIRVLGAKRILTILALLVLNGLLAASVYLYLVPEKIKKQKELSSALGQISTVQSDIGRMQVEFDQLAIQQTQFEQLKERGFFGAQGRREAEKLLQKIQQEAGVVSAVASVQPGSIEDNEEAQKADHKILVSPVKIQISAVDDVDVFRYLYLVERFFPGHVTIDKIMLERKTSINNTVLRAIATGGKPQLVTADIEARWRTMIPQKDIIGAPVQQEGAPQ
ncbi:MAG: hypothetical protein WBK55_04095 [Alphaproteobacteria bacterium]